jgi:hypothetical protein
LLSSDARGTSKGLRVFMSCSSSLASHTTTSSLFRLGVVEEGGGGRRGV